MNKVQFYINHEFGLGGVSNYTTQQAMSAENALVSFFNSAFGSVERKSLLNFMEKHLNDQVVLDEIDEIIDSRG